MLQKLSSLRHQLILTCQLFHQKTIANKDGWGPRKSLEYFYFHLLLICVIRDLSSKSWSCPDSQLGSGQSFPLLLCSFCTWCPALAVPKSPTVQYLLLILTPDTANNRAELSHRSTNWGHKPAINQTCLGHWVHFWYAELHPSYCHNL